MTTFLPDNQTKSASATGRFVVKDGAGPRPVNRVVIHQGTSDPVEIPVSADKRNLPDRLHALLGNQPIAGNGFQQAARIVPPLSVELPVQRASSNGTNGFHGVSADEFLMADTPLSPVSTPPREIPKVAVTEPPTYSEPRRTGKEPIRVEIEKPDGDIIECWYDDVLIDETLLTLYFHHDSSRRFVYRPGITPDDAEPLAVRINAAEESIHLCRSPGLRIRHGNHEYILLVIEQTATDPRDFISAEELLDPHGMMTGSGSCVSNGDSDLMMPLFRAQGE